MNRRNVTWLVAIVTVGVVVALTVGIVWGLVAAGVTLAASEVVERSVRRRRRVARGDDPNRSLVRGAVAHRRRRT